MVQVTDLADKIADPELRRFASAGESDRRLVLVEPDLPRRWLRMERTPARARGFRPAAGASVDEELSRERTSEARRFLSDLLHQEPRWLATARTFVVEATGNEVARMAGSPLIKAIHPNRRLR
jgi:hypothetical protein